MKGKIEIKKLVIIAGIVLFAVYILIQMVWITTYRINKLTANTVYEMHTISNLFQKCVILMAEGLMPSHDYIICGDYNSAMKDQKESEKKIDAAFQELTETINNAQLYGIKKDWKEDYLLPKFDTIVQLKKEVIDMEHNILKYGRNDYSYMEKMDSVYGEYRHHIHLLSEEVEKQADKVDRDLQMKLRIGIVIQTIVFTLIAGLALMVGFLLYMKVKTGITRVVEKIIKIKKTEDFSIELPSINIKEIDPIINGFNQLLGLLRKTIAKIENLSSFLSQSAENAATSMEEVSATLEEINASMAEINDMTEKLKKDTKEAIDTVLDEEKIIGKAYDDMEGLKDTSEGFYSQSEEVVNNTEKVSQVVERLSGFFDETKVKIEDIVDRTEEIMNIIKKIEDVNSKINILSLNARIEAAKAKGYGGGFSVIAAEIKNLANRSQEALLTIEEFYKELKSTIEGLMFSMGNMTEEMSELSLQFSKMAQVVLSSVEEMKKVNQLALSVAEDMNQLKQKSSFVKEKIENVPESMDEVSLSTQQVASGVEEISAQIEEITSAAMETSEKAKELEKILKKKE